MEDDPKRWAAPLPRGTGDRLRALAMPALLCVIALLGIYRHLELNQSSWQGASFGMFATYDNISSRAVLVSAGEGDEAAPLPLPADLGDDVTRLKVVATDEIADALARDALAAAPSHVEQVAVEVRRVVVSLEDGLSITVETLARGTATR